VDAWWKGVRKEGAQEERKDSFSEIIILGKEMKI
jgi:hypothetical protein